MCGAAALRRRGRGRLGGCIDSIRARIRAGVAVRGLRLPMCLPARLRSGAGAAWVGAPALRARAPARRTERHTPRLTRPDAEVGI